MPAKTGATRAGSGLGADPQPAAGGRTAEEESLRGESGGAAELAGSAAGGVREEGGARAAAAHSTGAGTEKPQGTTGEEKKALHSLVELDEKSGTTLTSTLNVKLELGVD